MVFWILVAVMTAAVAAVLILPLLRPPVQAAAGARHDAAVYRDQLDELARDAASGLIAAAEAELARAEIARRLITAKRKEGREADAAGGRNLLAQAFVIALLPALGLCLYLATGSPGLPAQPLAARLADPGDDVAILIAKAEGHLAQNPDDGAGWDLLAPVYYRSGRMEDAANAFAQALRLLGDTPARLDGAAEARIALANGIVTGEAKALLERSLALEAGNPRAKFYLALALEQEGRRDEARAAYEALARQSPADAPWMPLVERHIAGLSGPSVADVEAAEGMSQVDRQAMIAGMVEGLAQKLKENPGDAEGWMRLIRSYAVLERRAEAQAALRDALKAVPAGSEQGAALAALARDLSLSVEDSGP